MYIYIYIFYIDIYLIYIYIYIYIYYKYIYTFVIKPFFHKRVLNYFISRWEKQIDNVDRKWKH